MKFSDWINQKYIEKRGNTRLTISEFAEFVGVSQSLMSQWMKPDGKIPSSQNIAKIAETLGADVYDVLGLVKPPSTRHQVTPEEFIEHLPPTQRGAFLEAGTEAAAEIKRLGIAPSSIEAMEILKQAMVRHGLM